MGKQLKWQGSLNMGIKKGSVRTILCTSLTANVALAGESKVISLSLSLSMVGGMIDHVLRRSCALRFFFIIKKLFLVLGFIMANPKFEWEASDRNIPRQATLKVKIVGGSYCQKKASKEMHV